ncbi:MAG: hypothetical protein EOM26_12930, partial [Alphaproteobacteria bacterium]|nr:hypothetical protein [Alphaproteobacteria bacterium]
MDSALDTMPVQEPATIIEAELPAGEVEERRHFRAYMSPETAAKIPYAGELAESMRRNLVIVSKADIFTPDGRPVIPDMPKIIWGGLTGASPDWSVNLADALGFPDVPGSWKMAAPQFDGVVSDAFNQRASSRPVDYNGDGVVDFGVITTQDLDMSPEGHLGYIAGLSSGAVTDAPGDAFCYSAFFFAHEARHVAQDPARFEANYPHIPLPFEIDADQGGFQASRTKLLVDGSSLPPTRTNILHQIVQLEHHVSAEDTVLFYFSGHGIEHEGRPVLPFPVRADRVVPLAVAAA